MIIIGINFGHDAAVAIIRNGKVLAAIEEEKVSRIKQDFGWPRNALNRLLAEHSIKPSEVDAIVMATEVTHNLGKAEVKYRFTKEKMDKNIEYLNRITNYIGLANSKPGYDNKNAIIELYRKEGFTKAEFLTFDHHLAHAASAYYASPIDQQLIITSDGHGGKSSFNFYTPTKTGLNLIRGNDYTTSVGLFYSMITKLLGFRPTRHEGKITGLAAYGKPGILLDKFRSLFFYENGKLCRFPHMELDKWWDHYQLSKKLNLTSKINLATSGYEISIDYGRRGQVILAWLEENTKGHSKEDIAFACQKVAEEVTVKELEIVLKENFAGQNVAVGLAGGVFANVRINQMIYETKGVSNIFVQPAMGDSGLAIGLAMLGDIELINKPKENRNYAFKDTYIGPDYTKGVADFFEGIKEEAIVRKMDAPAKEIAQMLMDNQVVGFWHGSMEWGPRALGRRSMILNTFDRTVNDSVNKRLNRTEFMPFAPSIIDYMMETYIPSYKKDCPAAEYMTITYDVDPKYHDQLQAVVHVDGTARPQAVKKETNPYYYEIIDEFYKLSGCGAIVNTSFNAHEEPIVSGPEVAYKALKEDRIDSLVIDNYLILVKKN
jgi:carbamoyltransferase